MKNLFTAVFDRLHSPHSEAFAVDLALLCGRYPADYVWLDGKRRYSAAVPYQPVSVAPFVLACPDLCPLCIADRLGPSQPSPLPFPL